ncbi:MAG: DUF45 domain-containing protein [Bacteroidaceae bacterium]|nr:DUF45 domain-containing protein [Bacteroidaceae bacterium]
MLKKSNIIHPRWGKLVITCNPKARRIIMRARPDAIHMTIPPHATNADIERALDRCGERLLCRQKENTPVPFDKEFSINAPNFRLKIEECGTEKTMVAGSNGTYTLYCPAGTDYTAAGTQQALRQCIKAAMKHCAGLLLPARLKTLAMEHGFKYCRCTVRDVHSRWGSCTSTGNISLNMHLVILPDRLIDYVLLHELCHTVEMNHSDRFWALLDRCTAPEKAKTLRAKLKKEKFIV